MRVLRALIVDDEAPAREALHDLLSAHRNVKVVGEADSAAAAASLCGVLRPDLVFLDVQMPKGDGFSILPKLQPLPAIIFVTAYDQFAVRAFDVNAIDYLLKPVDPERLTRALGRAFHAPRPAAAKPYALADRIILRGDSEMVSVFVPEVTGIIADENYTRVCLAGARPIFIRRGISEWESLLPKPPFLRAHRSLIINLDALTVVKIEDGDLIVAIRGFEEPLALGRRASRRVKRAIQELGPL